MPTSLFKDHFSSTAAGYAAYRPSYPIELAQELANISPSRKLALDCGCGTGQLSVLLSECFESVVATDASMAQIAQAEPRHNITYKTALAEASGLAAGSVDLITVAQAAHWLNLEKFYSEVLRVARPNAVIALTSYGVLSVEGEVNSAIQDFYYQTINQYWPPERRHVEEGYRSLDFPFQELKLPSLSMKARWTLEELMGYINTWSAVTVAQKELGSNPVDALRESLKAQWGDPNTKRLVTWPLSIRAGRIHPAST